MCIQKWRTANASVIGTSHLKNNLPCQDASACYVLQVNNEFEVLFAVVSDGAGTALHSDLGSELVVSDFLKEFVTKIQEDPDLRKINETCVRNWIVQLNEKLTKLAIEKGVNIKEFACTLVAAIVGQETSIFFQIGDGAIVVGDPGTAEYGHVFWPQHGEFANQTNFLTQDNVDKVLAFACCNSYIDKIALFSDGIERLVLDFSLTVVHSPAFQPIFEWLKHCDPLDNENPSATLKNYLNSAFINQRTDDDKTLLMASRESP